MKTINAVSKFGSLSAGESANGSKYGVAVLNLTYSGGYHDGQVAQNQLVLTNKPVTTPDNGTTLLLLGMSLTGLFVAGLRRSRKAATVRA